MAIRCFSSSSSSSSSFPLPPSSLVKPPGRVLLLSLSKHKPANFVSSVAASVTGKEEQRRIRSLRSKTKASAETDLLEPKTAAGHSVDYGVVSMHHVGILCQNLETSLDFYQNLLGLKINEARPHDKLPYRGAWLWVGDEMIHLMELPNPDPLTGRPEHAGRDRHACIAIRNVSKLKEILDKAGISYTLSRSGRPAIFTRDPDGNGLEFTQVD